MGTNATRPLVLEQGVASEITNGIPLLWALFDGGVLWPALFRRT